MSLRGDDGGEAGMAEAPSWTPDFSEFTDTSFEEASSNVVEKRADLSLGSRGENGREEAPGLAEDGEASAGTGVGDEFDIEVKMAETLINGLHQVEQEPGGVGTSGDRDQQRTVTTEQPPPVKLRPSLDLANVGVGSFHKRAGSGSLEIQRPKAAAEQYNKPPTPRLQAVGAQNRKDSNEAGSSRPPSGNISGEVLHTIASEDEEGRSRQRILAFAAKRYSAAVERNPDDHDALYNWALVLQESADNAGPDVGNPGKDALLEEACRKYQAATELCPTLHEAFYNWAIAISDRAKIRGRTKEAEELWKQACERYDKSVQLNWNSPQALNNWGLALQELGAIIPLKEKRAIVKKAIRKFRSAIRLRFDFHRAVYNLGTVLYGLAEDTLRGGRKLSAREPTPTDLYSQSAIYIAAAHALKPDYPVYRSALRLVRSMLPLPYVKAGFLTIPPNGDSLAPHSDWQRLWFVLNHEALYEIEKSDRKSSTLSRRTTSSVESSAESSSSRPSKLRIDMEDIVLMTSCADLSLPPGGGFRVDTTTGHHFLIADTWEAMDGWVDAIRLVYTIFARGKRDSLAGVLG